jgi:hypothetical protein
MRRVRSIPNLRFRYIREKMAREVTRTVIYARGTIKEVAMAATKVWLNKAGLHHDTPLPASYGTNLLFDLLISLGRTNTIGQTLARPYGARQYREYEISDDTQSQAKDAEILATRRNTR